MSSYSPPFRVAHHISTLVDISKYVELKRKRTLFASAASEPGITMAEATRLNVGDEDIEEVGSFCYLDSMITNDGVTLVDVSSHIAKARSAFANLFGVWH